MRRYKKRRPSVSFFDIGGYIQNQPYYLNAPDSVDPSNVEINTDLLSSNNNINQVSNNNIGSNPVNATLAGVNLLTGALNNANPTISNVNTNPLNSTSTSYNSLLDEWAAWSPIQHVTTKDLGASGTVFGQAAGSAVSGAAKGAQAGSVIPGVGTAIGAGVGALFGGISSLFGSNKRKKARDRINRQIDKANEFSLSNLSNQADNITTKSNWDTMQNYFYYGGELNPYWVAYNNGGMLNNLYAKGGSIHIKPENKGKFNATKKRTGKSTEELTHSKNPLTRKRAIFAQNAAKWNHAFGGSIFNPSMIYNHGGHMFANGGLFSNGLNKFNEGGTHEENPFGGIPVSISPEGQPNLVEENEVKWNDYIFSDRLIIDDDEVLEQIGLHKGLKGKSFAKAAEYISDESKEREEDPISKDTLNSSLSKLQYLQEMLKEEMGENQPDVNSFANGGLTLNNGNLWDFSQLLQGAKSKGVNRFFFNGEVFNPNDFGNVSGALTQDVNDLVSAYAGNENISDNVRQILSTNIANESAGNASAVNSYGYVGLGQMGAEAFATQGYLTPEAEHKVKQAKGAKAKNNILNNESNWRNPSDYQRIIVDKDPSAQLEALSRDLTWRENWINNQINTDPTFRKWVEDNNYTIPNLINAASFGVGNLKNASRGNKSPNFQQREYNELLKRASGNATNAWSSNVNGTPSLQERVSEPVLTGDDLRLNQELNTANYDPVNNAIESMNNSMPGINETINNQVQQERTESRLNGIFGNDLLRYAPVAANAGLFVSDLFSSPERENLSRVSDNISPRQLGNYMQYNPFDSEYLANRVREQAGGTRRAIQNNSGGNRGQALAGLLAADYNTTNALGDAYARVSELNDQKRQRVEEFNRGTNMFNIQNDLQAQQFNAGTNRYNNDISNQERLMNAQNRAASRNARREGLTTLAENIGAIATENRWFDIAPRVNRGYDALGIYNGNNRRSNDGKIYKRKIK